ncbi:MAG: hypothetical protein ACR2IE_01195 [Candidatus Sumerlaeaceae bacterium]
MLLRTIIAILLLTTCSTTFPQAYGGFNYDYARQYQGFRRYYNYPYYYSWGPRYDPYWSYNSSYFPYQYHNDGSYYGLGYSGYAGDGWYGSYWYW